MSERVTVGVLIDRVQAAVESGVIDVVWEGGATIEPVIALTDGELARLMIVLFPEEYRESPLATPTKAAPGSSEKIDVLCSRFQRGQSLFSDDLEQKRRPLNRESEDASDSELIGWLLSSGH